MRGAADEAIVSRAGRRPQGLRVVICPPRREREEALRLLNSSERAAERSMVSLRIDPMLLSLHDDPRFRALAARIERPPGKS